MLDPALIRRIAQDLGTHPSLIEKDWHVVRALAVIATLADADVQPVFSGGTSLAKGWGLIKRFSEDIDFKAIMPAKSGAAMRKLRSRWRTKLIEHLVASGFVLENQPLVGNASQFVRASFSYGAQQPLFGGLRQTLQVEVTFVSPQLTPAARSIQSFVGLAERQPPEVRALLCVDPVETAADKISALAWRTAVRDRASNDDDATIVRHIHDLAALIESVEDENRFVDLARKTLAKDAKRTGEANVDGVELLRLMLPTIAQDPLWQEEYDQFVRSVAFGPDAERIDFDQAMAACKRLVERILQQL